MFSRRFLFLAAAAGALALGALAWVVFSGLGATFIRPYVALAAAAGGAWVGWKVGREVMREYRAELRVIARVRKDLGLNYERKVPEKRMRRFFSLPLFDTLGWRSCHHLMSGPVGEGSVLLFDCDPRNNHDPSRTVLLFPDVGLPEFEVHPRRFWDFAGKGVRFYPEDQPDDRGQSILRAFLAWYTVEALEEGEVRRVFTPERVSFFVGHPGWEMQSYGGHLALFKGKKKVPLGERPELFREAVALARLFHPPLGAGGPLAGRAAPAAGAIQLKPARLKESPPPGPVPSSDERFVGFE